MNVPGLSEERLQILTTAIRQLAEGSTNSLSSVTLRPSFTTTVVTDVLATVDSHIDLCPLTANAAAALANTYVSSRLKGSFTLTHGNTATTDRTFSYRISRQ